MGKTHSPIKVNGKVGNDVHYMLNGIPVVRRMAKKKRGPKSKGEKERLLYNRDFGKASKAGKFLRRALEEELQLLKDRYVYQRVNRLSAQLFLCDPAAPGERLVAAGLATSEGQALFSSFVFHHKKVPYPQLKKAIRKPGKLCLEFSGISPNRAEVLELQVNFSNGAFRKHAHHLAELPADGSIVIKRIFRSRKGFTDLVMVSGEKFLQGVVVTEEKWGGSSIEGTQSR